MPKEIDVKQRCVNIDWLEVYVLESNDHYPCNADYYRRCGYLVDEREYGTRVYKEMFTIVDSQGNPLIEVRRNPKSGDSNFKGLVPESSHIRLPNWMLYQGNPVDYLREFLLKHDYIFKRIYRLDICYDFEYFDSGDQPQRFVQRYMKGIYRKINQCERTAHGKDGWEDCIENSLSWGSRSSMVSTKLYNKSLELSSPKSDKPYIKTAWMLCGLIDNPMSMTKYDTNGDLYHPDIWRLEFSMKSEADGWLVIEMVHGKKVRKQAIPHRLEQFDAKDKIWKRFQDLAYHYFCFKYREYVGAHQGLVYNSLVSVDSVGDKRLKRKDRCRDKVLFYWDKGHEFLQLSAAPPPSKGSRDTEILKRRLIHYRATHPMEKVRLACDVLLKDIEQVESFRFTPKGDAMERMALQLTLNARIAGDKREALEILAEIKELLVNDNIF